MGTIRLLRDMDIMAAFTPKDVRRVSTSVLLTLLMLVRDARKMES